MSHIVLGTVGDTTKPAKLDVDLLLRTRLLIQASSGAGKSWLLRRMAEQLYGEVPVILIDPEGEFATLREKYGYVLVGKGGDTPADIRSAGLVAIKLLELRASAVCDIFEMKPAERHEWVKRFLDAMIDAPKKLWRPVVVVVDEAHMFAPEKGMGESVAAEAMIGLTTRGRKRGFCAVFATQRLAKLRNDAAAELLNVMVGQTFIDADVDRVVKALGIAKDEHRAFRNEIKTIPPGTFWMFGRALSTTRRLITVGDIKTSHPKPGSSKHAAEPPPAPDTVRKLLPSLADLPAEAETKARTEAELRRELAEARRELGLARKQAAVGNSQPSTPKTVEKLVLTDADRALLVGLDERIRGVGGLVRDEFAERIGDLQKAVLASVDRKFESFASKLESKGFGKLLEKIAPAVASTRAPQPATPANVAHPRPQPRASQPAASPGGRSPRVPSAARATEESNGDLGRPELKILGALAELEALGLYPADKQQLGLMAGYTNIRSGGFSEPLGRLMTGGYVSSPRTGQVEITDVGRRAVEPVALPTSADDLQARILDKLEGPEQKLLGVLLRHYPDVLAKEELAAECDPPYTNIRSGGFSEPLGRLNRLGLIRTPQRGSVVASPALFLEER